LVKTKNNFEVLIMENLTTTYLEELCKKYNLAIFENPRDNFITLISSNKTSKEELWLALDIYDDWLISLHADDDNDPWEACIS
jgi:hypothetical protein